MCLVIRFIVHAHDQRQGSVFVSLGVRHALSPLKCI